MMTIICQTLVDMASHQTADPNATVPGKQSIYTLDRMMRPRLFVLQKPTRRIDRLVNDMPRVGRQTKPFVDVVRQDQKDVTKRRMCRSRCQTRHPRYS